MRQRNIDELLWCLPTVIGSVNAWEQSFCKSILRQSRRKGWKPSAKQLHTMHRLVDREFDSSSFEEIDLIDEET